MNRLMADDFPTREALVSCLREGPPHLSVGLLAADAMAYGKAISDLEAADVGLLHFDVMDGVFCPQMTAGAGLIKASKTKMLKDVHLMVDDPLAHLDAVIAAGADIVHVHAEGMRHLHRALVALDVAVGGSDTGRKILRSVALNPGSPVSLLQSVLHQVEMVTLLAVDPGWSGGAPDAVLAWKIEQVRALAMEQGCKPLICIDGGITSSTFAIAAAMKPDIIVSGSAVFKCDNVADGVSALIG